MYSVKLKPKLQNGNLTRTLTLGKFFMIPNMGAVEAIRARVRVRFLNCPTPKLKPNPNLNPSLNPNPNPALTISLV